MKNWNLLGWSLVYAIAVGVFAITGCDPAARNKPADTSSSQTGSSRKSTNGSAHSEDAHSHSTDVAGDHEHEHEPGAHGGIIVSLGRESYHVEAVVDSTGSIRLYTLGKDESRVIDVESQTLKGFVKAESDADSKEVSFEPTPQAGDTDGKTSLFVGQLPPELVGRKLDVTIPNIRIAGERFRLGFSTGHKKHTATEIPDKLSNNAERELYLTPGGRYTAADIEANGNVAASQKFRGIQSSHDMNPKVGDYICPITETKANPSFTWVVDGKSYQFCCPPCVSEFVKMAKSTDKPLPDPDTYIKQP